MNASELFVKALENEGVEYIFGIPGEENLDFLDALRTSNIKLILTRHEQGAGFMAATYGRLTGKVGVCLSTLGPGATNFATSAAYAQLGGMPMMMITGQKPIITKAKKSIAAFKLREGMDIGCKVTLRSEKMYEFATKLFNVALPRVRDFKGVNTKSFDGKGNYSMGIKEQLIFPEIEYDKIDKVRGMDVIFVTTANTDAEAKALLSMLGLPFAK